MFGESLEPNYAETLTPPFPAVGLQLGMKHGERIRDCREPEAGISLQGLVGEVAWLATQPYVTQPYVLMPAKHYPALRAWLTRLRSGSSCARGQSPAVLGPRSSFAVMYLPI